MVRLIAAVLGVAAGLLGAFACGGDSEGLSQPTSQAAVRIESISPSSGTIGTEVIIHGSGFDPADNDIAFTNEDINFGGNNTAYVNGLASSDGSTLLFDLPDLLSACAFSQMKAGEACPLIGLPLPAGDLAVAVVNRNGSSNTLGFEREKSEIELATEVIDSSPSYQRLQDTLDEITKRTGGTTASGVSQCDGRICIDIWIEKDVPELSQKIPSEIEGFEVRVQEW